MKERIVIIGGGFGGLRAARALKRAPVDVTLIDRRNYHLFQPLLYQVATGSLFPEDLSKKAERALGRLGVQVKTGVVVKDIDREGVTFDGPNGQERLDARTVIWAGGVTVPAFARVLAKRMNAETDKAGRIKVSPDLTVPNHPDIYVIGDLALAASPGGEPLPGVAQVAMQQGTYAGNAIANKIRGKKTPPAFKYFDKGTLAVIGRAAAVANVFGLHLSGLPAWLIWALIHLMYLVQFQSRVLVFIQWAIQDLTFNRGGAADHRQRDY